MQFQSIIPYDKAANVVFQGEKAIKFPEDDSRGFIFIAHGGWFLKKVIIMGKTRDATGEYANKLRDFYPSCTVEYHFMPDLDCIWSSIHNSKSITFLTGKVDQAYRILEGALKKYVEKIYSEITPATLIETQGAKASDSNEQENTISDLKGQINHLMEECGKLTSLCSESQIKENIDAATIKVLRDTNEKMFGQIRSLSEENERLEKKVEELEDSNKNWRKTLDAADSLRVAMAEKINEKAEEVGGMEKENAELKSRLATYSKYFKPYDFAKSKCAMSGGPCASCINEANAMYSIMNK